MNTPETKVCYVNSQVACAFIEAMGMQAENKQRKILGQSMAYNDDSFFNLIEKYGINHNAVITIFNQ
jgi:hypothetical protein